MRRRMLIRLAALGMAGAMALGCFGCSRVAPKTESTAAVAETKKEETSASETESKETSGTQAETEPETETVEENCIEAPSFSKKDFPVMDGSTATLPLGRMLYRMSVDCDEKEADQAITFTKTTNSYIRLIEGEADIVIAYEAGEAAKELPGYKDLEIRPIGLDALIFLCNSDNPVESLTTKQIQDIYSGKLTNWKEVGAKNFDKEIVAFQRPDNSGSQTLMKNLMMKNLPMADAPAEYRPGEMGELVESVASYNNRANALGYSVYYYANNMYMLPGIRFMAVDDVMPTNETIRSGKYKYVNPFYAAIRRDTPKDSAAYELFTWLTGVDGQALVNELGYVGYRETDKKLPKKFAPSYAKINNGKRKLVLNGEQYDGNAGIVVFGDDMHPEKRYSDVRIRDTSLLSYGDVVYAMTEKMVDKSTQDPENYGYYDGSDEWGLFNIKTGEWLVEPIYDYTSTPWIETDDDLKDAVFYLAKVDWEKDVEQIDAFDANGNPVDAGDVNYENFPYGLEFDERYKNYYSTEYSDIENGSIAIYRIGKDGSFTSVWKEKQEIELVLKGKKIPLYDQAYVQPYERISNSDYKLPLGWTLIRTYQFDDDYDITNEDNYLINEDSEIVYQFADSASELIVATKDYMLISEYDSCVIRNYDGDIIYSWKYSRYDPDYDYRYE